MIVNRLKDTLGGISGPRKSTPKVLRNLDSGKKFKKVSFIKDKNGSKCGKKTPIYGKEKASGTKDTWPTRETKLTQS